GSTTASGSAPVATRLEKASLIIPTVPQYGSRYTCLLLPSVVIASVRLLGSLRMALSACPGLMIVRSPTSKSYWRHIHARLQMFGLPRSASRVALRSSGIWGSGGADNSSMYGGFAVGRGA